MIFKQKHSRVDFLYRDKGISVFLKREDLLHKYISGNKFRKLKYNIIEAINQKKDTILTFGGAFSNHIAAMAYAGKLHGFKTIGVIRGDELGIDLKTTLKTNSSLRFAVNNGMKLHFIDRESYRKKKTSSFQEKLKKQFENFYLVPEGGTNQFAIKGCEEILTQKDKEFDYICTAVGTGGTIAGLINSAKENQKVIGFPALKGDFLKNEIEQLAVINKNWKLMQDYHFGGFAKINSTLVSFINEFKKNYNIPLDPIYTGKMMFGIHDLIQKGYFKEDTKILAIHTGGLQGIAPMNIRLEKRKLAQLD